MTNRGRRVSRLVLLRYLELCIAVGVKGDGDEIRSAAHCTVFGVDLPRATTGIYEGVVLLAAERARVGHGSSEYRKGPGEAFSVILAGIERRAGTRDLSAKRDHSMTSLRTKPSDFS